MYKKIHKHLKRKLHPNRYFIWTLSIAVMAWIALFGYIVVSNELSDSESIFSDINTLRPYSDQQQGFMIRYPKGWLVNRDQNGNIIFQNPHDLQESVTVASADVKLEGVIRHSVDIASEQVYEKDGMDIHVIKADSAKDGASLDIAIIKKDSKLFYISGYSKDFQALALSFKAL